MAHTSSWRLAAVLLGVALLTACSKSLDGEYALDVPSDTDPNVHITKVIISEDATVVRLRVVCPQTARLGSTMGVFPPGHQLAFYIMSTDRSKRFNLVGVEGVAIRPNATRLRAGESLEFSLTFERIDNKMNHFHLIEGEAEHTRGTPWHFLNVSLSRANPTR